MWHSPSWVPFATRARADLQWCVLEHCQRTYVQEAAATAETHLKSTEATVLDAVRTNVKQGITWAQEYPYAAYSMAAVAFLLFPGPRSFVAKHIFGVFQSQVCSTTIFGCAPSTQGFKALGRALNWTDRLTTLQPSRVTHHRLFIHNALKGASVPWQRTDNASASSLMQESAFRGASEKFAHLSESTGALIKSKEAATETASIALEELIAARSAATAAHDELATIATKLETSLEEFERAPCLLSMPPLIAPFMLEILNRWVAVVGASDGCLC